MSTDIAFPTVNSFATASTMAATLEAIVFELEAVWFGVPLAQSERILDATARQHDFNALADVEIVDLSERLFGMPIAAPAAWTICTDALTQRAYAIPLAALPTLISIPLDRLRLLPPDLRASSPLGIASHVALLITATQLPIFLVTDYPQ